MSCPLVSVVIVNFNGLNHLPTCLNSASETDYSNFEIILIDNGSTDGSVEYVKCSFPKVKIVQNSTNLGPVKAYNAGIANAKGKYVAILNNDIELDPDWLIECVRAMESDDRIGLCDSKYLNYYDRSRFDSVSAAGRFIDMFGNVYARGCGELDKGQFDKIAEVFAGLALFRKSALDEAGIFDETFFYGYDEIDLCWRMRLKGYKVVYVPKSKIYHKVSQSAKQSKRMKPTFYFNIKKNRLQMLIKNHSLKGISLAMPIVLTEYSGYLVNWVMKRDKMYFSETVKAMFWVLVNFKAIWTKHELVQGSRKVDDGFLKKVIVPYCGDFVQAIRGKP